MTESFSATALYQGARYPDLAGKVAVVTGASCEIGAAISRRLAEQGAKVGMTGRDPGRLAHALENAVAGGAEGLAYPADCTRFSELEALRLKVEDRLGLVELVVAVAGGLGEPIPTLEMSESRWHATIDANLTSAFFTMKCFLPGMIARRRGAIVTMASTAGRSPSRACAAYGAAKAGLVMLTRQIAQEVAPHGVRVNCVSPSAVRTARLERSLSEAGIAQLGEQFPLRRIGTPDDVAASTLFLLSDASAWLTGMTLDVTGGRIAA